MCSEHEQPAIFLVQWGAAQERNEIALIRQDLPDLTSDDCPSKRITDPEQEKLWTALQTLLAEQQNIQILYFSAHGDRMGNFAFSRDGTGQTPYHALVARLGEFLATDCVHLVLGTCHAMSCFEQWSATIPRSFYKVTGFHPKVGVGDVVALIVGVIEQDQTLLHLLSKQVNWHIQEIDQVAVDRILADHDDPTEHVSCDQFVVSYTRRPNSPNEWEKKFFNVSKP